jgi:hypothetical protein
VPFGIESHVKSPELSPLACTRNPSSMSSNHFLQTVVIAVLCAHVSAIVAVWYSPWGANGLFLLNGLLALITVIYGSSRFRYIFLATDWSYLTLIVFELAVLAASVFAFRGNRPALMCSYVVFGLHACATVAAVFMAFVFRITRLI